MKKLFLLAILIAITYEVAAEIYRWKDEEGMSHFSDKKPPHLIAKKIQLRINTYESVSYDRSLFDTGERVVMYSTEWCAYCKKAKKYFTARGIPFIEYDIEKNSQAKRRYNAMGARGVPVILVGDKRMNGFSEMGFEKIYKR